MCVCFGDSFLCSISLLLLSDSLSCVLNIVCYKCDCSLLYMCVYVHGWVCVIAGFHTGFLLVGGRNCNLRVRLYVLHLRDLNSL